MKITCIVQRYGVDVVGGAERLCRGVAEGLAAADHDVEVLTSCARSYVTWANAYPEGVERVNGVLVRRFRSEGERDMEAFNARSETLFGGNGPTPEDETAWVEAQGPRVPGLVDFLHGAGRDRDRLLFFTYLYYPTVHGMPVAPERSVLVPTAHDEAPLYLSIYDRVFELPAGMVFNTRAEAELVRRRFSRLPEHQEVIGVGIDDLDELAAARGPETPSGAPTRSAGRSKVTAAPEARGAATGSGPEAGGAASGSGREAGGDPVVLYAGRIEPGKGVDQLVEYLGRFRRETGNGLRLWLMGEAAMELPGEDWIEPLGYVDDDEKVDRFRRATVLALPSTLESFGIVALEAMAAGTPVLANAGGAAAVEHCESARAGLWYRDYAEFREALTLLLDDPALRHALQKNGASYVRENYSWPRIVKAYENFLERLDSAP